VTTELASITSTRSAKATASNTGSPSLQAADHRHGRALQQKTRRSHPEPSRSCENAGKNRFTDHRQRNAFILNFVKDYNRTRLRCLRHQAPAEVLANLPRHTFATPTPTKFSLQCSADRPPAVRIGSATPSNPRRRSVGRPPRLSAHTVLQTGCVFAVCSSPAKAGLAGRASHTHSGEDFPRWPAQHQVVRRSLKRALALPHLHRHKLSLAESNRWRELLLLM
jgi:hypothetical protein